MTPILFLDRHYVFIDTGESSCPSIYFFSYLSLPLPPYLPICHKINHFLNQRNILIRYAAVAVCTTTFICVNKHPILCISQHWVTQKLLETNSSGFIHLFTLVNRMGLKNTFSPKIWLCTVYFKEITELFLFFNLYLFFFFHPQILHLG